MTKRGRQTNKRHGKQSSTTRLVLHHEYLYSRPGKPQGETRQTGNMRVSWFPTGIEALGLMESSLTSDERGQSPLTSSFLLIFATPTFLSRI